MSTPTPVSPAKPELTGIRLDATSLRVLAHPLRSFGRFLPWEVVPELAPERLALLWATRVKTGRSGR